MGEDATVDADRTPARRRVEAPEATEIPGITEEAVRGRIKRGTLAHERTTEGVYVLLARRGVSPTGNRFEGLPRVLQHEALLLQPQGGLAARQGLIPVEPPAAGT